MKSLISYNLFVTSIILISDNHGEIECIDYIKEKHKDSDYFFHLGDSVLPSYLLDGFASVQGNNDRYKEYPDQLVLEIADHRFLLTHGHKELYWGGYDSLYYKAKELGCDIVCYGHTHIYDETYEDDVLFLNPGSIIRNRDGSVGSYMKLTINGKELKIDRLTYEKVLK